MNEKTISRTINLLGILLLVVLITQLLISFTLLERLKTIEQGLAALKAESSSLATQAVTSPKPTESTDDSGSMALNELKAKLEALKNQNDRDLATFANLPGFKEEIERLQNLYNNAPATTQPKPSHSDSSSADERIKKMMEETERLRKVNERDADLIKQLPGFEDFDPNEPVPTTQADSASVDPEALFQMIKEKNREHGIQMEDHHIRLIVQKLIENPDSVLPEPKALDPDSLEDLFGSENNSSNASE